MVRKKNIPYLLLLMAMPLFSQEGDWQQLLDKELTHWDVFMGVPHFSVKGLDTVPKGDGKNGTPLGLNNDPLKVFRTLEEDGEILLYVSGEIFGGLTSKDIYKNYHLKLDFKWGQKKWEPRLNDKRDNGLLYHCIGEHGAFWNVWMQSQEFQIQEGDMGDYFGLAGSVNTINSIRNEEGFYAYNAKGPEVTLGTIIPGDKRYRCIRKDNFEKPNGDWNTLELICFNGSSYHLVNGHVVMVLNHAATKTDTGFKAVTKGKIQLQSEAAEAYYRNIEIKEINALPDFVNSGN